MSEKHQDKSSDNTQKKTNIIRREGYVPVGEDFVEKRIRPNPKAMQRFWQILLPEVIEIIKKEKIEVMKKNTQDSIEDSKK